MFNALELNVLICWKLHVKQSSVFLFCRLISLHCSWQTGWKSHRTASVPKPSTPSVHFHPKKPWWGVGTELRLLTNPSFTATSFTPHHPSHTCSCCHHIWEWFYPNQRVRESERRQMKGTFRDPPPPVTFSVSDCCDTWRSVLFAILKFIVPIWRIHQWKLLIILIYLVVWTNWESCGGDLHIVDFAAMTVPLLIALSDTLMVFGSEGYQWI